MACENCIAKYSSNCIEWEGDCSYGDDIHEIVAKLITNNSDFQVDMKTLSLDKLDKNKMIQVLVDKIIRLDNEIKKIDTTTSSSDLDCTININNVSSNNLCDILNYIISEVNTLKTEVTTLKNSNEYM
jgi:hypothetical protein